VESVLATANESMERKYDFESRGFTLDKVADRVASANQQFEARSYQKIENICWSNKNKLKS
jgi:hypothetical protein